MQEAVGAEAGAPIELQNLEDSGGGGGGEQLEIGIGDNHAAEVERLHPGEGSGDLVDPGGSVAAPVLADEVEHGGARLALDFERLELGEAARELRRSGGVAEGDGDVLAGDGVDLVPALADERDRAAVARVGEDALPNSAVAVAEARDSRLSRHFERIGNWLVGGLGERKCTNS